MLVWHYSMTSIKINVYKIYLSCKIEKQLYINQVIIDLVDFDRNFHRMMLHNNVLISSKSKKNEL